MNKSDINNNINENLVEIASIAGIETAIERLLTQNISMLPNNMEMARIKTSAGFYIANNQTLMGLDKASKLKMLHGILKEATLGLEAGTDYDIVVFRNQPVFTRKAEGWFKIINDLKPADIVRFSCNVIRKGDKYSFNPVTEELTHEIFSDGEDLWENIIGSYCYIKFANGFEKTILLNKNDIAKIKAMSPSAKSMYSPWNTHLIKMIETKTQKELCKQLVRLFSRGLNPAQHMAVEEEQEMINNVPVSPAPPTSSVKESSAKEIVNTINIDDL